MLADKECDITVSAGKAITDKAPFAVGKATIKTAPVNASLVGVWKYPSTVVEKYDLKADGTGIYTYSSTSTNIRWKTVSNKLITSKMSSNGMVSSKNVYSFNLSDPEVLTLTGVGTYLAE